MLMSCPEFITFIALRTMQDDLNLVVHSSRFYQNIINLL